MSKYLCTASCQVAQSFYEKGVVYEAPSNPDSNYFSLTTEERITYRFDGSRTDMDGTYFYPAEGWEDLRFPVQAINPPGLPGDPSIEAGSGMFMFSASATNTLMGAAQMPHSWKTGSLIAPHVHWTPTDTGAGNVLWRWEYKLVPIGSAIPSGYTPVDAVAAAGGVADKHLITKFGLVSTGGSLSLMILWKLSRIGGDVADTYGSEARLLEFDIHYQIDSLGSGEEMEK